MHRTPIHFLALVVLAAPLAFAHCDGLDGPVVAAGREALRSADVNLVMPWVQPGDEPAIRQAFARALKVRKLNPDAAELADTWFFETLVRIHRAGEGAPYDGLKPAGRDLGPAIPAADKAIETGDADALEKLLSAPAREQLHKRFHRVVEARNYNSADVKVGREYVAAYVDFVHYVERLYEAITAGSGHAATHEH